MIRIDAARELSYRLFREVGLSDGRSRVSADALVLADAWGVASHGLLRLPYYLSRAKAGGIRTMAELVPVTDAGAVVAFDGNGGHGHWQVATAAEVGVQRATEHGISAVAVGNSNHCGCLGVYTLHALSAGFGAIVMSHGPAVMPPWGGQRAVLSTSPLAIAVPAHPQPVIADLATSAVARGRIAARRDRGEPLDDGWAFDRDGVATTDPTTALDGMLAPLGGAKGYALAVAVEALTAGMIGPALSADVADMFASTSNHRQQQIAHMVLTVDPSRFDTNGHARERLAQLAASVSSAGGRIPGAEKRSLSEYPPETQLPISAELYETLRRSLKS